MEYYLGASALATIIAYYLKGDNEENEEIDSEFEILYNSDIETDGETSESDDDEIDVKSKWKPKSANIPEHIIKKYIVENIEGFDFRSLKKVDPKKTTKKEDTSFEGSELYAKIKQIRQSVSDDNNNDSEEW